MSQRIPLRTRVAAAVSALLENTRFGNAFEALMSNRYEGAQPSSPDRSWVPALVRDARFDANSFSRLEMFRKITYWERNVWLLGRLGSEYVKWTVGPNGLPVIPDSSDSKWNGRMLESYLEWCESPFLDSTLTMSQGHRLMARSEHFHGGLFVNFTRSKLVGQPAKPAIQFIESPRCSSPGVEYALHDDSERVDGVQLGLDAATGEPTKPIGYWIRDGITGDKWVFRSTSDMLHVFDPTRIGMFREITPYHAVLNTLHDLDDLELMEMQRAKKNSEVANIITNATGEIHQPTMADRMAGKTSSVTTDATSDARLALYKRVLGASTLALKNGEKLEQFDTKNPSAATQWYWRYKIGQVAAAANVPLILVFPELIESAQGTVVRGIYDNAHQFFRGKSHLFAHAARRMYRFYANWARYNDPRCVDAPADWNKCHVLLPRAVNVDVGRNGADQLAQLAAGTTSYDDIYGASGSTAEVGFRKKAMNVAMIKRIAKEVSAATGQDVDPAEIAAPLADIIAKLSQAQGGGGDDDEDDPQPTKSQKGKPEKVEA